MFASNFHQTYCLFVSLYKLLTDSHMTTAVPELTKVCVQFLALPVTVASAERSVSRLKLIITDDQRWQKKDLKDY